MNGFIRFSIEDRMNINHNFLYNLMTYGDGVENIYPIENWNKWSVGSRGILTWLVMDALDIKRHPWHPDACQRAVPKYKEYQGVLDALDNELGDRAKTQAAVDEIRRVYDHTQAVFAKKGISKINLYRSFEDGGVSAARVGEDGYATKILKMSQAARSLGYSEFEITPNILSSWNCSGNYGGYPVTITVEHPIENIIWGSNVIASKHNNSSRAAVESGEWVVVNRAINGRLRIPVCGVSGKLSSREESAFEYMPRSRISRNCTCEENANRFLADQDKRLEPFEGYTLPHNCVALNNMNWRDRLALAVKVFLNK